MNYQDLLTSLTPEVYTSLKSAVELGKWPDGRVLTQQQREQCLEAVIAYEYQHLEPEEAHRLYTAQAPQSLWWPR